MNSVYRKPDDKKPIDKVITFALQDGRWCMDVFTKKGLVISPVDVRRIEQSFRIGMRQYRASLREPVKEIANGRV